MNRKAQREALLTEARSLATKAETEGRDLNPAEVDRAMAIKSEVAELDRLIKADEDAREAIKAITADAAEDNGHTPLARGTGYTARVTSRMGKAAIDALSEYRGGGLKAVTEASGKVGFPYALGVTGSPDRAALLQQLVDVINVPTGRTVHYLRQVGLVEAAKPAAIATEKSEAEVALEYVEQPFATLAHHIRVPKQWLYDVEALKDLVQNQMVGGVLRAVEDLLLNDTEPAEDGETTLHGLRTSSGVQLQPFETDALTSIQAGLGRVEDANFAPNVIVMNPSDWRAIVGERDSNGQFLLPGVPTRTGGKQLFDARVFTTSAMPAGEAITGAFAPENIGIAARGNIELQWDPFSLSTSNQVRLRVEGRFSPVIPRPAAFARVTLEDAG